jgi:hypothetical protein
MGGSLTGPGGIGGKTGTGQFGNAALGAMYDPFNVSGMFGTNSGPGAFMNPNGQTGGAIAPGKSFQSVGINGNPLGIGNSSGKGAPPGASAPAAKPPMSTQNMGQQVAAPQPRPAPAMPQQAGMPQQQMPQNLQQKQAIQYLMQSLGGST